MFEEEFIIKHINYVFNNWKVTYEDLDQDVDADYNSDALPKSVEDLIYDYYTDDIGEVLKHISNNDNLFFLYDNTVLETLSKIDVLSLNKREQSIIVFLKENFKPYENKCCWDLILDNFYNVLETLREKSIAKNINE